MWKPVLIIGTVILLCPLNAYKILIVIPTPSKSHAILGDGLVKHLSEAGHEITYITAFAPSKPHSRVTVIDVSDTVPITESMNVENIMNKTLEMDDMYLISMMLKMNQLTIENPQIQKLLTEKNQQFDVVIAEWLISDIFAGFSAVFNCPLIWFSPIEPHWMILELVDEPSNPAYSVGVSTANLPPLSFKQRVKELYTLISGGLFQYFWLSGLDKALYEKHFAPAIRDRGYPVPSIEALRYNGSLVLVNSHVSMSTSISLPQNVIPIGGFHIGTDVKPLPQDLQKIMDESKHGVIYFSLGSNLRSKHFPRDIKQGLLGMFGKLKQTVLWKFEEDLPDRPSNVHILNWAPQQSILAHKNCILFITHGGLLSSTESIHFGVPMVGIPVFGDQFVNVERYIIKGIAKRVDLSYGIVTDLEMAVRDMLDDPKYTAKVKALSQIYHDRPIHPGKESVHWVEHVVRTKGALHLRSPAFLTPWYQKMYLDLALMLALVILILTYTLRFTRNRLNRKKQKIH